VRSTTCENCGATDQLEPSPRWGGLMVCGRCFIQIARNIRNADPETLARWDHGEAEVAAGRQRRGVGPVAPSSVPSEPPVGAEDRKKEQ
jgi:hypothetical protein